MSEKGHKNTYVITGATSGIGLAIMDNLIKTDTNLIGLGRSPERCQVQADRFQNENPEKKIQYLVADLTKQTDIRAAAKNIEEILSNWNCDHLDGLINNAGTFTFWQSITSEGFETQWAVNHLAPFLLTHLLLPKLKLAKDARVITISSGSHYGASLRWSDIQGLKRYNPLKAYKRTKLANVIFTAELNRRLGPNATVRGLAADPGLVNTGIGEKSSSLLARKIWKRRREKGISPSQSATGIIKLLHMDEQEIQKSIYWKHGLPKNPNPYSMDEDHGWRLWEISSKMTGISL